MRGDRQTTGTSFMDELYGVTKSRDLILSLGESTNTCEAFT